MLDRNFASCLVLEHRCLGVGRRKRTRTHSCNNHHNHNERLTSGAFPHSDKEGAPTATTASSVTSNDHDERFDLSHPANEAEGETSSSSSHVTMMIKIQQRLTLPCVIIGYGECPAFFGRGHESNDPRWASLETDIGHQQCGRTGSSLLSCPLELIGRLWKMKSIEPFRRLALKLHTDKNAAPGGSEAFQVLNRAKEEMLVTIMG